MDTRDLLGIKSIGATIGILILMVIMTLLITLICTATVQAADDPPPPQKIEETPAYLQPFGAWYVLDVRWQYFQTYEPWKVEDLPDGNYISLIADYNPFYEQDYYPYIIVRMPYLTTGSIYITLRYIIHNDPLKIRVIFYGVRHNCYENWMLPNTNGFGTYAFPSCLPDSENYRDVGLQTLPSSEQVPWPYRYLDVDAFTEYVLTQTCEETPGCKPWAWLPVVIKGE